MLKALQLQEYLRVAAKRPIFQRDHWSTANVGSYGPGGGLDLFVRNYGL